MSKVPVSAQRALELEEMDVRSEISKKYTDGKIDYATQGQMLNAARQRYAVARERLTAAPTVKPTRAPAPAKTGQALRAELDRVMSQLPLTHPMRVAYLEELAGLRGLPVGGVQPSATQRQPAPQPAATMSAARRQTLLATTAIGRKVLEAERQQASNATQPVRSPRHQAMLEASRVGREVLQAERQRSPLPARIKALLNTTPLGQQALKRR